MENFDRYVGLNICGPLVLYNDAPLDLSLILTPIKEHLLKTRMVTLQPLKISFQSKTKLFKSF